VLLSLQSQLESEIEDLPEGWTVAAKVEPAEGVVAGDCYDIVMLSPSSLAAVVIDVAGHGPIPGILALRCRELLRAALRGGLEPGAGLTWAHEQLDDLDDEQFLSAFVATADLATGRIEYASAGHPPAFLCAPDTAVALGPTGPILGAFDAGWETRRATMGRGDTLTMYTDGLIEVYDEEGHEYGLERLVDLICGLSCDDAEAIVKRAIDEVSAYSGARLRDDATVLLVCRGPRADRAPVRLPS